jgi:acetylornithine deacetylase/succinyl-diaminopimelate desuccinylase-like protein
MLSGLTSKDGHILLSSVKSKKRKSSPKIPVSRKAFAQQAGVLKANSVPDDFWNKIFYEPSLSINAIQASSEKLANNIICDRAYARVGIRLTAEQKASRVQQELLSKLKSLAPSTVEVSLKGGEPCDAWSTDPHRGPHRWAFAAAERSLKKAYRKDVVYIGCGATIPFIAPFEKALKAPVLTLGVEDPYTLAHSENESLLLSDFYKTIEAERELFFDLAEQFKSRGAQALKRSR